MKRLKNMRVVVAVVLAGAFGAPASQAQSPAPSPGHASQPAASDPGSADMMAKMMALANPGENHKLLEQLVGTWECKVKFWMVPGAPPSESSGTAVRKPVMGGRYFITDTASKMEMPGEDGKMHAMDFKGMSIDGYDNVKQKFVSTWIDNGGTGILMSEGTYDPATKTFTYLLEEEMVPGTKQKVRETVKIIDKDHHLFEWYEDRGGKETKTMEVAYARQK